MYNSFEDRQTCQIAVHDIHRLKGDIQQFDKRVPRAAQDYDWDQVDHSYRASAVP